MKQNLSGQRLGDRCFFGWGQSAAIKSFILNKYEKKIDKLCQLSYNNR
jgi:hypothetical protein